MTKEYDLAIIGGGPGGYVAAIKASQLGLKVAVIEKEKVGGTCLHQGCIPTKTFLRSAEVFRQMKSAKQFGVDVAEYALNFMNVQKRKAKVVDQLYRGVQSLLKKNNVSVYDGIGRILGPSIFSPMAGTISIEHGQDIENTMLIPKNIIIATGSKPATLPGVKIDGEYVLTSDDAIQIKQLPKSIIIVGGGVIGVEWASLLADFNVAVTLIEYSKHLLPTEDIDISKEIERQLRKKGVEVITEAAVQQTYTPKDGQVKIDYVKNETVYQVTAEKILLSVGRTPNTDDLGLNNTSISLKDGFIETNEFYQTAESHIYAIGDVIGGKQLAHVASHEGMIAVEHMAGKNPFSMNELNIPACVYSHPEVASIGLTEQQAKEQGYSLKIGSFPFQANGKALIYGESEGFIKIIANEANDDLLGIHMIGPLVTEMISEGSLAKLLDATPWELTESIQPHPTLTETIGEAALAVEGKSIHY